MQQQKNNFVCTLDNINIGKLTKFVEKNNIIFCPNKNEHLKYFFKYKNWTVSLFNNNKLLIQGENAEVFYSFLFEIKKEQKEKILISKYSEQIGMDEVGTGDTFGGVVMCSCYIEKNNIKKIIDLGVDDSKKINDDMIVHLYHKIKPLVTFEVMNIYPKEYNEFIIKYKNFNVLKTILHNKCLLALKEKIGDKDEKIHVILDQYVNKHIYFKYLEKEKVEEIAKISVFTIKAESKFVSVACASIIARYFFLEQFANLCTKASIGLAKGSSNKLISEQIKSLCKKNGKEKMDEFVKLNFSNVKELIG